MRPSEKVVIVIGGCLLLCSCAAKRTLSPPLMTQTLTTAHWVPLDFPDSKVTPGSVIANDPTVGVRWLGHVRECGVPDNVLTVVQGNIGDASMTTDGSYDAKAILKIKGVEAGPEFTRVSKAVLSLSGSRADSIDLIRLQVWLSDPANQAKIAQSCNEILRAPNAYLVQEAFYVGSGKYTLTDSNHAQIAIKGLTAGPLKIDPSADAKIGSGGTLEMKNPVYIAIRRVKRVDSKTLIVLGANVTERYDDADLIKH